MQRETPGTRAQLGDKGESGGEGDLGITTEDEGPLFAFTAQLQPVPQ